MNKCNEWNCTYNKNGTCETEECLKEKEQYYSNKEYIIKHNKEGL